MDPKEYDGPEDPTQQAPEKPAEIPVEEEAVEGEDE